MTRHPLSSLFTDLYELTMAQAYAAEGMRETAVFELFFRDLPATRNYVLACGLESVLNFLEQFHFSDEDIAYLRGLGKFSDAFLDELAELRFTGDVWAVREGTAVFPHEPIIQITAPITEAQLVETCVLNQVHGASVIASKAARMVTAAQGRAVIDFGARRAFGNDAAMTLARSSYIAGATATSNLMAGRRYGIPVSGTMAHSYIQAHDREFDAFERFAREFPDTTLLIDTYDTVAGAREVIRLVRETGLRVGAVRLDSGDLASLSRRVRTLLDEAGLEKIRIIASNALDEDRIAALIAQEAPIDGFGIGTRLAVSKDAPDLDLVYKLVEYAGRPRFKTSIEKVLMPERKQVFRQTEKGTMVRDVLTRFDARQSGNPLLVEVMRGGRILPDALPPLESIRAHAARQLAQLPPAIRRLEKAEFDYAVEIGSALKSQATDY